MVHTQQNIQDVREFVANQKQVFGQTIVTIAGNTVKVDVKLPKAGMMLLGFGFSKTVPDGNVSVKINNEIVIEDLNGAFLDLTNKNFEYFEFPRPLSATDVIKLTVQDTAVKNCFFAVYYV